LSASISLSSSSTVNKALGGSVDVGGSDSVMISVGGSGSVMIPVGSSGSVMIPVGSSGSVMIPVGSSPDNCSSFSSRRFLILPVLLSGCHNSGDQISGSS
jgi:hypothetical protein